MSAFMKDDVVYQAERQNWSFFRYEHGQGQMVFLERHMRGERFELHVWCTTGTVGSYLDHPHQGKQQLYRRNVDWPGLRAILNNPRVHTGTGYHERAELERRAPAAQRERAVACPGCNRMYYTMGDTAQHFESGRCPSCPGQENARRQAYAFARQSGTGDQYFTNASRLLTFNGAGEQDYSSDYQPDGTNFKCPGCHREFRLLSALLNHQQAKPQCRGSHAALGFGGY